MALAAGLALPAVARS